jgi:hypothetical protein
MRAPNGAKTPAPVCPLFHGKAFSFRWPVPVYGAAREIRASSPRIAFWRGTGHCQAISFGKGIKGSTNGVLILSLIRKTCGSFVHLILSKSLESVVLYLGQQFTNRLLYKLSYLGSVTDCNIAVKNLSNRRTVPSCSIPLPRKVNLLSSAGCIFGSFALTRVRRT